MHILLIEDDSATAQTYSLMFAARGFTHDQTDLGEEGIALAARPGYDIIVTCVSLPDICGHDVVRAIRARGITTPILIVSGWPGRPNEVAALGANGCLTKPFHADVLSSRMHAVLRDAGSRA